SLDINNPSWYTLIPCTINNYLTNATVRDFENFTWPTVACTYCGYMQGTTLNLYYDNATCMHVGTTATNLPYSAGTQCDIQFHFCDNFIHDSTFQDYNFAPGWDNWGVLLQNDAGHPDKGYVLRSRFIDNNVEHD